GLVEAAAADGARLICLPENFSWLAQSDAEYVANAVTEAQHPALARSTALARELAIWLLLGSLTVRESDGRIFNRCLLIDPSGAVTARYDKIHLFDVNVRDGHEYRESDTIAPGTRQVVADTPWGGLGMSICYDVRFPHLYRALARAGARWLTVPAAFTRKTGEAHWHVLLRARAIETGCFVIAPGQCGTRPWGRATFGHSLIIDPWGTVIADGGTDEGVVSATVDPAESDRVRAMIPSLEHDRPFGP
ncbi:MAG: carbon-nitrogen hydrolase family protein, partial [Gammaproteobacteria bacterium]|nr:carbon-nitrogen hydrolase family protein [Gammaproteobacteria bacterium]